MRVIDLLYRVHRVLSRRYYLFLMFMFIAASSISASVALETQNRGYRNKHIRNTSASINGPVLFYHFCTFYCRVIQSIRLFRV